MLLVLRFWDSFKKDRTGIGHDSQDIFKNFLKIAKTHCVKTHGTKLPDHCQSKKQLLSDSYH